MIKLLQIKNKLVLLLCLAMLSHTLFGAATNEKSVDPVNTSSTLSQSHQIFSVGDVLMVVGNTTLGTGDAALKSELENMGFTVVVKQDSDAQTSDASGKLLVLISSTVNSGNVGTKFTSVAVPLINWEQGLFDELNITSGATGTRGNASGYQSVIINDASHPLAAGLSGTVQVYTSSGTMPWVMVAGDGVNIASHVADGSSVVYGFESGDNMYNSFVAPAKRVGWFLYDTEASMLTADGWALVRASIHWATDDIANSDEEAPSVPENITHTAVTENSISLSWDVATDNIGVTGYKIYQDNNFITEISITSHTINSLVSSTSYSFEISAVDEAGNESARSSAYAISTSGETEAPSIPGNLQVSNIQGDRLNLSWTASTDNVGVSSYEVFKDDVLYGNVSGTSLIIQGLSPETTYSFKVEAIDAAGNRSGKSAAINATTISNINIPAHETQLFSKQNGNWANLSTWSTDAAGTIAATSLPNGTTQVVIKGHEITLNSGPQESGDLYIYDEGTPGKLTINNAKLTVKGEVSIIKNSQFGNRLFIENNGEIEVVYPDPIIDTLAPTQPQDLIVQSTTFNSITLSWTAASDDIAVAGYYIYQDSILLTTNGAINDTTFTVTGLAESTVYNFTISAVDAQGNESVQSASVAGTTSSSVPVSVTFEFEDGFTVINEAGSNGNVGQAYYDYVSIFDAGDEVEISFNVEDAGTYILKLRVRSGGTSDPTSFWDNDKYQTKLDGNLITLTGNTSSLEPTGDFGGAHFGVMESEEQSLSAGTHTFRVRALSSWQVVDYLEITTPGGTPPVTILPPTNLVASNESSNSFDLSWTASTSSNLEDYQIFVDGSLNQTVAETVTSTTITGLSESTTYSVMIKAIDKDGNLSAASSAIDVTTGSFTPVTSTFQFEGNYSVVADVGSNGAIVATGDYVTIYDTGDEIEIDFTVPTTGTYTVKLRVRSGGSTGPTSYWTSNKYETRIDGTELILVGDPSTTVYSSSYGGSYFGIMELAGQSLTAGNHTFSVKALSSWQLVDYLEITTDGGTPPPPTILPPTNLVGSNESSNSFDLSWTASTSSNLEDYQIFVDGSLNQTVAETVTSTTITGLSESTTYSVTIKAIDKDGNLSAASSAIDVTTGSFTPVTSTFQFEGNYSVVADVGSNGAIVVTGDYVTIYDTGDEIELNFNVPTTGTYTVKLRVRSGGTTGSTSYWSSHTYETRIDGTELILVGDPSTTVYSGSYGGSYFGIMELAGQSLTAGNHTFRVKALSSWQLVDYLEIVKTGN